MAHLKYTTCVIIFLKLTICYSYTIDIFDTSKLDENGKPILIETVGDKADFQRGDIRGALRSSGLRTSEIRHTNIFEDFVMAMLDLLLGYPGRMMSRYCMNVYRQLDKLEYKYTRKLAKHFRELSRMDRDELRDELRRYQQAMKKKTPLLEAFIADMNRVFTMEQGVKFRDYVFDVRDYGNLDKRDVVEETQELLKIILRVIKKLGIREQNELEKKMRRAVRQFDNDDTEPNIYSSLFYSSTPSY